MCKMYTATTGLHLLERLGCKWLQNVAEGSREEILKSARMKTDAAKWLGTGPDLKCQLAGFALIVLDRSGCRIMLHLHARIL